MQRRGSEDIDVALGRPPKPEDVVPHQARFSASEAVFVPPGRVRSIEGVDEARAVNGVTDVIVLCEEGDTIPEYQSCAWDGSVMDRPSMLR